MVNDDLGKEVKIIKSDVDKIAFQLIVHTINQFRERIGIYLEPKTIEFRKIVVLANPEDLNVKLKKFGDFEYVVEAKVFSGTDSWIHVDGIAAERAMCREKGDLNHECFKIVCLTDIFDRI